MRWVSYYVVRGIQKAAGTVGKVIIAWPVVFLCTSLAITLAIAGVGMPILFQNVGTDGASLGKSTGPGQAAYLVKNKYFPSTTQASQLLITFKEGQNSFDHLQGLCELQRSFEDNELFKKACAKDHQGKCAKNMYDTIMTTPPLSVNRTADAKHDCEQGFNGALLRTILTGIGERIDIVLGFPITGNFEIDGKKSRAIVGSRQMILNFSLDSEAKATREWEEEVFFPMARELRELKGDLPLLEHVETIEYLSGSSIGDEATKAVMDDVPLIGGSFLLMFIYCIVMLVRKWKFPIFLQTRLTLAMMMMCTATFALAIAYGIQGLLGMPFSSLSLSAAFIIYGVGIDDTFVVVDAYARIVRDAPKKKRHQSTNDYIAHHVLEAYVETADAIVLTTLTDCVAFFTGAAIDVIAMRGFCIVAGIAVLSVFTLQSCFFLPCLVLDERRRLDKRYDVMCCLRTDKKKAKKMDDAVSVSSTSSSMTRYSAVRAMFTAKERFNFLSFLFNVPTAAFVSVAFAVTGLGVGTWSWLNLERNLNPTDLLPQDSYVIPFLNSFVAGKMDRFPQFVQYIFEDVDFTNPSHRADIIRVYQDALEIPEHEFEGKTIRISPSVLNPGNIKYLQQNYPSEIIDEKNPTFRIDGEPLTVEDWLLENPGFRESFNRTSDGKYFTKFALTVYTVGEYDTKSRHRKQLLDTANRSLPDGESELKLHLYEPEFSAIDRFLSADAYFFDVLLSSILGVFTVTLFFTLPMYALVSTFIVVLVICWILLIFPLGGIDYNTILVLNLVMAIGFAVDYCAHIGQCFANNAHLAPKPRALLAINTMAGSVLKAGFSTILAVSCLVFAKGQIALILLKCFVMMVCMGLLHALVFLPSVLFLLATIYNKMVPAKVEDSPSSIEDGTADSAERSRTTKTMARPGAVPHVRRNLSEAII